MPETTPQHQFNVEHLDVQLFADKQQMGVASASFVVEQLQQAIDRKGEANLVVATGNSQHAFLLALREIDGIDWSRVTVFHLDEYLGISDQHIASFRLYLQKWLFDHISFRAVHLLNGDAPDAQAECKRYSDLLAGQEIDVACIGIGENGHLAFNDPPADFETSEIIHVVTLDEACRLQQVGEGYFNGIEDVPTQALSMSIPAIMSAKVISCVVPEQRKADAVKRTLEENISPMCPATVLRTHPDCHLFLDAESASKLSV
jgi:glucosamine-6-phosphate deaminase